MTTHIPWTVEDDKYIREWYGKIRPREMVSHLNRTRAGLYHRAEILGLTSTLMSGEFLRRQSLPRTAIPFKGFTNDLDKGYVAGIIDGEGSICKPPKIVVAVATTTKPLIDHVYNICGGSTSGPYLYRSGYGKENCKPQYKWSMTAMTDVYEFLKAMRPYLIIKYKEAEIGMKYLENRWK